MRPHGLTGALLLFALGASASPIDCPDSRNQSDLNACTVEAYGRTDGEMNLFYQKQIARLTEPNRSRLRDAQRAWLAYRDKSCLYEVGPPGESGSIWGRSQYLCLERFTRQRISDLKGYVTCVQDGCPN